MLDYIIERWKKLDYEVEAYEDAIVVKQIFKQNIVYEIAIFANHIELQQYKILENGRNVYLTESVNLYYSDEELNLIELTRDYLKELEKGKG